MTFIFLGFSVPCGSRETFTSLTVHIRQSFLRTMNRRGNFIARPATIIISEIVLDKIKNTYLSDPKNDRRSR